MKKIIEIIGINFSCTDEASTNDIAKLESTISLMEKIFSNSPAAVNLIEEAIAQGLTEVIFTPKDKDLVTQGCHIRNNAGSSMIKIDINLDPIDIIDTLLFELYNVVNLELNNIDYQQYKNAETYADEMEKAEYNTFINNKKLVLNLLQLPANKEILDELLSELNYSITYEEIIQEKEKEMLFSFDQYLDLEHREIYVNQWLKHANGNEEYDKKLMQLNQELSNLQSISLPESDNVSNFNYRYVDITSIIQRGNINELEKALFSSNEVIYSYHIDKAINLRNNKILELLLKNYKEEIYDFQINDLVKENNIELIKTLLPNITTISSYTVGIAIDNENIEALELLLDKGYVCEYQLFSVKNEKIIEMVKNHPNYEHAVPVNTIDLENHDQNLTGETLENNFDSLS